MNLGLSGIRASDEFRSVMKSTPGLDILVVCLPGTNHFADGQEKLSLTCLSEKVSLVPQSLVFLTNARISRLTNLHPDFVPLSCNYKRKKKTLFQPTVQSDSYLLSNANRYFS